MVSRCLSCIGYEINKGTVKMNKKIQIGTIALIHGKLAIITEISTTRPKNPIGYKNNTGHRGYIGPESIVGAILGTVDVDLFEAHSEAAAVPKEQRHDAWMMPQSLRDMDLQVGDMVKILDHGIEKDAKFTGYNGRRPKNPVAFVMAGRNYKGSASLIVSKSKGQR